MLAIIQIISNFVKPILAIIAGFFGFFLFKKNQQLQIQNVSVEKEIENVKKVVNVQNKVIKAKKPRPTNFDGVIKQLRNEKL